MSGLRILAFAYACESDKGSEPGAGWAWARSLGSIGETWVITRENNRPSIEAGLATIPEADRLHFVYVDLPPWARFWKKGQRGVRLYYLLWQARAALAARELGRTVEFDLVWHLTMANLWLGSLAPLAGGPFVYGPVGGGVGAPWRYLNRDSGFRGIGVEVMRAGVRGAARYLNPVARIAWAQASLILVQNPETLGWLPARHRRKAVIFPNPILEPRPDVPPARVDGRPTAIFAGRLIFLKGIELAIRAVAMTDDWHLVIYGSGNDERRLRKLVARLGAGDRVHFAGWVARDELIERMGAEGDVFLFPSLHDEAPWSVAEALSCGLPVACVDRGGPPVISGSAGMVVPSTDVTRTVRDLAEGLASRRFPRREDAFERAADFTRDVHLERLIDILAARDELGIAAALEREEAAG
jgi:glycosyltransferase involved in cell wall biosynthesis